jgi:hypothetical protein
MVLLEVLYWQLVFFIYFVKIKLFLILFQAESHEMLTTSLLKLQGHSDVKNHQIGILHDHGDHSHHVFPWAFLIAACALILLFFFEKVKNFKI